MKQAFGTNTEILTPTQASTIKQMFVLHIQNAVGKLNEQGIKAAKGIADDLIKDVQMAILQSSTYGKAASKTKAVKVAKKVKKHVRK